MSAENIIDFFRRPTPVILTSEILHIDAAGRNVPGAWRSMHGVLQESVRVGTDVRLNNNDIVIGAVETQEDREAIFALRMAVFVEEQRCPPEEELDAYDVVATHFLVRVRPPHGDEAGRIVATARLLEKGQGVGKIGRVAVLADYRGLGLGAALMRAIHAHADQKGLRRLVLDAQCQAIPFYEKLGYTAEGDIFLDANIEHRRMWTLLSVESIEVGASAGQAATPPTVKGA